MKRKILIASVVAAALGGTVAMAQTAATPTNPNIFAAVQQVQTTLNGLVSGLQPALTNIQNSLNSIEATLKGLTPAPVGNVLNTTILDFVTSSTQSGQYRCQVTNVSAANRTVVMEIVETSGAVHSAFSPALLSPGKSTFGGLVAGNNNSFRCRFTVQDGTKQDVVAAMVLSIFTGPNLDTSEVSVDAR